FIPFIRVICVLWTPNSHVGGRPTENACYIRKSHSGATRDFQENAWFVIGHWSSVLIACLPLRASVPSWFNRALILQNFQPFLEENDVDWKIWKIYMRFSRGKRLFSTSQTFLRSVGKYKPRVFP